MASAVFSSVITRASVNTRSGINTGMPSSRHVEPTLSRSTDQSDQFVYDINLACVIAAPNISWSFPRSTLNL
jgi:hypothetical protein